MFKRKYSNISGDPFKLEDDLPPCPKITKHDKVPPVQKVTSANNLWADKLCTHLNTFKMESSQSIRMNLSKGQWVASVDLEDAYFHIPVRKSFRKYLRFHTQLSGLAVQGTSFRTVSSPLLFHRSHGSSELSVSSKR